ncbi:hypothetical protein H0H81_005570 [Sphagnurus paluster]|uniref:Uncharacterized protein n=1 Tax=Sphagnurus paluster TaxID=117069 RepID=A0A9P7FYI8_9AGAR|nr:hypothetical protein H0H81_005570 [Sphagnurus paluster]
MAGHVVGEVTPTMLEHLGFGTFVFFGANLPGLTLEEMDEVFGSSKGLALADQERQAAIHRRLGLLVDTEVSEHVSGEKKGSGSDGQFSEVKEA